MKLFLTSSCISEDLRSYFLENFDKVPRASKCYFIPTASDLDESKFYTCKSMDDLVQLGFSPIWYPLQFKTKELLAQELADADIIWVGGGNTFYLLEVARRTGFLEVITDLVKSKNVVYGGISAGSLLACPQIRPAGWEPGGDTNDVGITDFSSLNFVNFIPVVHFENDQENIIKKYASQDDEIYTIPDGGMIVVDDETIALHGGAKKYQ
jgi:dipeptidase E